MKSGVGFIADLRRCLGISIILIGTFTLSPHVLAQDIEHLNVNPDGLSPHTGEDPFISSNGRFVVFIGSFLVPQDVNGTQAYLYDRELDMVELVSQAANGASANGTVALPQYAGAKVVSEDGRYVVFQSLATNLPGTLNPIPSKRYIWLRDRVDGVTKLISKSTAGAVANQGNVNRIFSLASDGWAVLFNSTANNLDALDVDNFQNTFLYQISDDSTKLACYEDGGTDKNNDCDFVSLACSGTMAFQSANDNTVAEIDDNHAPGNDVFFGVPLAGANNIISVGPSDEPSDSNSYTAPAISCNGQRIAFGTPASLTLADDDGDWDLYIYDNDTSIAALIRGPGDIPLRPDKVAMSPNGKWISFTTTEQLDPIDTNNWSDVYALYYSLDRQLGDIRLVSQISGVIGNNTSTDMAVSDNGEVAFESNAGNFAPVTDPPNAGGSDIFVDSFRTIIIDGFEDGG